MNRFSSCRSDSKPKHVVSRLTNTRCSLQNERASMKRSRSSSLEVRARGSGSASKPRSSSEDRKSSLFAGHRRSSINFEAGRPVKDCRPLTDKAYQKKKLTELFEFLSEGDYPHPISLSKLMQPSKKDFENVFHHLICFFDPTFEINKLEEDGPKILKTLRYPFIPNKSAFVYVARTNWPSLMGVLLYLMEMIKFSMNIDEDAVFHNPDLERPEEHAILLNYIFDSYCKRVGNDEEEQQIFEKIIRARWEVDVEELECKKEEKRQELERLQNEVNQINALKDNSQELDSELRRYEEFFLSMKEHKRKKEESCQKLSEEVAGKEAELKGLKEILAKKLAIYDAQGYDGKKQLSYFESQKKELLEKLEERKSRYRELLNEVGEAEIQHSQAMHKSLAVCETFNQMYASVTESLSTVLDPLRNIQDPQIKSLCANFTLDFPDCRMDPYQKCVLQWSNSRQTSMEEVKQKMDSAILIFKGLCAKLNQKLHGLMMKKSELAVNLKIASSEEKQKEQELTSQEKQALEEVQAIEKECNEMIKHSDLLQAEIRKDEEENSRLKEQLNKLENKNKDKRKLLEDYLAEQRKLFATWKSDIEETTRLAEESGERINQAVEEAMAPKSENI